ncbi:MAG: HAMP domain-containing protein [Gammaproteobacteria bacterium]|nr:HAMP domain-containing protein [Rhodocyclaceae bacterium]MBU3909476.1 HAMP domain-containing protein [Gammaproteobacteria bacterium]MBU3990354.1 HAMP domain-containing protein [Gammaproteobacteria bacterium]MBU4003731.1 HAMP domain-containing protein [Gammaproteobacteria bacterium]MBU4022188.1 HAMP domain-containing protein [Gammaproteobacteria bacterium]
MNRPTSLARQNTLLLAAAFILIELLAAVALSVYLILPLARRSADDLAGLMILSAQTWAELPPQTRIDFEFELLANHALALRAETPGVGVDEWHPPYFYLLEDALANRSGTRQHLVRESIGDATWYWTNLPAGSGHLAVGLSQQRIGAQPWAAFLIALLGGLALASGVAVWLARRITAPLARLEQAATRIGQGESPELLPETGPTELAALASRFNAMARQVRELLQARTTMLVGVSHDLRTPLARMRLALELLKLDPTPALIERLESDIEEMNGLIATLLDLARGLEREPPVTVDLADWLSELAADFATPERTVTVSCPPCQRSIPPQALRRAIGNLLQNALRHAPAAAVELVGEIENAQCRIGVLDRGPGIPPEQIEAMFQPFHRLDPSRSPATGGAGLGLAIVRELARANGWDVRLEPRPGGGLAAWLCM